MESINILKKLGKIWILIALFAWIFLCSGFGFFWGTLIFAINAVMIPMGVIIAKNLLK